MTDQSSPVSTSLSAVPWGPFQVSLALAALVGVWGTGVALWALISDQATLSMPGSLIFVALLEGSFLMVALTLATRGRWASVPLLGFRRSRGSLVGWGLVALLASLFLAVLYSAAAHQLAPDILRPPPLPEELGQRGVLLPSFVVVVFWGPLAEEVFFRGFVLPGLVRRWGFRTAAVASALLFAISHGAVGLLVPAFLSGLVLAWVYRQTSSLWPGILAHATQNAVAFAMII